MTWKNWLAVAFVSTALAGLCAYAAFDNYIGGYSGQHQNANENIGAAK
jgi:hypothetical protein